MLNTIGRIPAVLSNIHATSLLGMLNTIGRIQGEEVNYMRSKFARYVKYNR